MRSWSVVVGFLAALAAFALLTFFMLGYLGRESDPVILGVIGCTLIAALGFWYGASHADDSPRGGK